MAQPGSIRIVDARESAELDQASLLVRTLAQPTGAFVAGDGVGNENDILMQGHDTLVLYVQSVFGGGGAMTNFTFRLRFAKTGAGVAGTFFEETSLTAGVAAPPVQPFNVLESRYVITAGAASGAHNHRMSFAIPEPVSVRVEVIDSSGTANANDLVAITAVRSLSA